MRALAAIIGIMAPVSAFASGGSADDSGIFVWLFLGFCAKLFVSQVVTAFLLVVGMAKATVSVVKEEMAPATEE